MDYSPFDKDLRELSAQDLAVLRFVEEGWYVEYKRSLPRAAAVAKSLAAFANHHGGWLFYGVREADAGPPVASEFPGIAELEVRGALDALTAAAARHIDPTPLFEYQVVDGPSEKVGLDRGRSVIVVRIPRGGNAPYIHSSGKIYRRRADASDPAAETDRAVLDLLYERTRRRVDRLKDFVRRLPQVSKAESEVCYVHLFLMTDPWHQANHRAPGSFAEFSSVMRSAEPQFGGIPFDNCYSTAGGFIARQARHNNPRLQVLTWAHFADNSARVTIPLPSKILNVFSASVAGTYLYANEFSRVVRDQGHEDPEILDLNLLASLLMGCIAKYHGLNSTRRIEERGYAKLVIENAWRRVPYLDVKSYVEFIEAYGAPVVQDDTIDIPDDVLGLSLLSIDATDSEEDDRNEHRHVRSGVAVLLDLCDALGIPREVVVEAPLEPFEAAQRAASTMRKWDSA